MRCRLMALTFAIIMLAGSGRAFAWWSNDWAYRVKVTADAGPGGANITDPIGRTQILMRLHAGNFDFTNTKEDGGDLRLVAGDDKTPLHYHIERFSQKDQIALIWVDLTDLAPGASSAFYLYWGNPKAADGSDPRGTFDPDQVLVYHFTEENGLPRDATGFGSNALTAGTRDEAGMIGFALRLARDKPLLRFAKSAALAIAEGQPLTVALWAQPDPANQTSILYSDRDGAAAVTLGLDQGAVYGQVEGPAGRVRVAASSALAAGWHHIAWVSADKLTLLVDGRAVGEAAVSMPAINGQPSLGGADQPNAPRFTGLIDELRISKIARPFGAIRASVAAEGPDGKLLSFDPAEQNSAGSTNYFLIIVQSVTPDAWVVIGMLGLMSLITWVVMVSKTRYLNRVAKANRAFLVQYRRLAADAGGDYIAALVAVAERETAPLRASSLHRLARIAVREMQERLDSGRIHPSGMLSTQSLAAIRASMETGQTHEQHRASNMMVLLTVAISGGPFLGLLGTVVGVMITFAAIAAAGDVNVNAIAPGIAAALLATVAGLGVAIPAMFGYNYLLIRARDVGADLNAFVNETITKMGEARMVPRPMPEPTLAEAADPRAARPPAAAPKRK